MTSVANTNRNGKRPKSDLYSTPFEATHAFIRFERRTLQHLARRDRRFAGRIWEPAAGEGWLAEALNLEGFETVESDLNLHPDTLWRHRGKVRQQNFMTTKKRRASMIVTNPPFSIGDSGDEFVRHALRLRPRYAAFFLPITFQAGLNRADILEGEVGGLRLARVLVLSWRCTLKPPRLKLKNDGVTCFAWFIWERGHKGPFTTHRLYRSAEEQVRYTRRAANENGKYRYRRAA